MADLIRDTTESTIIEIHEDLDSASNLQEDTIQDTLVNLRYRMERQLRLTVYQALCIKMLTEPECEVIQKLIPHNANLDTAKPITKTLPNSLFEKLASWVRPNFVISEQLLPDQEERDRKTKEFNFLARFIISRTRNDYAEV